MMAFFEVDMEDYTNFVSLRDLYSGFSQDGRNITAYNGCLSFRKGVLYTDSECFELIKNMLSGRQSGYLVWEKTGFASFRVLLGEDFLYSLFRFLNGEFHLEISGNLYYFYELPADQRSALLDQEIPVYILPQEEYRPDRVRCIF